MSRLGQQNIQGACEATWPLRRRCSVPRAVFTFIEVVAGMAALRAGLAFSIQHGSLPTLPA